MRNGAPFHGSIGEGRNANPAESLQAVRAPWAGAFAVNKKRATNAPATDDRAVATAVNWRPRIICPPPHDHTKRVHGSLKRLNSRPLSRKPSSGQTQFTLQTRPKLNQIVASSSPARILGKR